MQFGDQPFDPYGYDDLRDYFDTESNFMAADGYAQTLKHQRIRQAALHVIIQIMGSVEVDALVPYLSMNYFDRYVSRHGYFDKKGTIMEDVEFLVVSCISIAYKTTLSLHTWSLDFEAEAKKLKVEMEIRQFLAKRTRNMKYLKEWKLYDAESKIEEALGGGLKINPITPLRFIEYFLSQFKPQCEVPNAKERITKIILELQDDIRLCDYKPSVISASAVTAIVTDLYPVTFENMTNSLGFIEDKEKFKLCLHIVKEMRLKKKLSCDDYGTSDVKLRWMIATDVEDTMRTLVSVTRVSIKVAAADVKMRHQAQQIRGLAEEIKCLGSHTGHFVPKTKRR